MKKITRHIPNTLTCLNLFVGCVACVFAFVGEFTTAACLMLLAAVFDFADGLAARALNAYSKLGKELDSLADVISFGFLPGIILFSYFVKILPADMLFADMYPDINWVYASVAFFIPVFSALRLAKFNIDTRQANSFLGLATPANAIFWGFLVATLNENTPIFEPVISYIVLMALMAIFCGLLIAPVPMFSLKFKDFSWKKHKTQYIFLMVSAVLLILFQLSAFPLIIGFYIVLSLIHDKLL